jgi:hypothetical protein
MSTSTRNVILTIIGVVVGFLVIKWAIMLLVHTLLGLLPIALVIGGAFLAYQYFGRKALTGGRRTLP